MKNTMTLASDTPTLKLGDMHKLTTDAQNLAELLSAATVVVSQLEVTALPPEIANARDRLKKAIMPVNLIPIKKEN